jgi:glutamate racemase
MKIGFFDSGLGGLTILKAVATHLPQYDYLFYGDTANLPYGDKSEADIYELTKTGVRYLFEHDCALAIIACNTASAETTRRLQDEFLPTEYPDRKILGVIVPTVEALNFSEATNVILIATKRTVESKKYELELKHRGDGDTTLLSVSTPALVPLIEMGELETAAEEATQTINSEARASSVIVLGCTHYTMIKDHLREEYRGKMQIISQDEIIPSKLKKYLDRHKEAEGRLSRGSTRVIHLTKHRPDYDDQMDLFLGGRYVGEE